MIRTRFSIPVLTVIVLTAGAPGCVSRRDAEPVAAAQLQAMARLADAHRQDLAALRGATEALLTIDRETTRGAIERAIAGHLLTATGDADAARLLDDIASGESHASPLADEVARGAMTPDEALSWLRDYAAATRLEESFETRDRLLSRLTPLRERDDAGSALLEALDTHAARLGVLAADALQSSEALLAYTRFEPESDRLARTGAIELWRMGVVESLDNPEKQEAAERAMQTLLSLIFNLDTKTETQ
ncbi:MAG: hypothetical protein EA376_02725 [Phycisphaeraceae bacterium]|nr:MAG: hypothetical protein EA376_02725 [Phycisphaeraceae bacterium]